MNALQAWALRHAIDADALADLMLILAPQCEPATHKGRKVSDESSVQQLVRLEAAAAGWHLWRNNVGVLEDKTGRPVRYGLANDSKTLNAQLKSSDLIGWRRVLITADMVGSHVAQFACREIKKPDWRYTGTPREEAQQRWIGMVLADGGDACFANGVGTIRLR